MTSAAADLFRVEPGSSNPLGATWDGKGVNFALFSAHAERVDLCIFDPKAHWTLSADKFVSRGRNSPFLGWEFTGRVTHTLVGGEMVFELAGG